MGIDYEPKYANLHLHSTHSDGVYSPSELVRLAKEEGYKALAVTDHDVISGIDEMVSECEKQGMDYIKGAEFTCQGFGLDYHIVGLDLDLSNKALQDYCAYMGEKETHRTKTLFDQGIERGTLKDITWDEVLEYNKGIVWFCVDHVFAAMLNKGVITLIDYNEFFMANFTHRLPYETPYKIYSAEEVINIIKGAGGIATLAHPHEQLHTVEGLVEMGLGGIEVWHRMLTPEERVEAERLAKKHNLYISGGTDHAGLLGGLDRYEPDGKLPAKYFVPPLMHGTSEENFKAIKNRIYG